MYTCKHMFRKYICRQYTANEQLILEDMLEGGIKNGTLCVCI